MSTQTEAVASEQDRTEGAGGDPLVPGRAVSTPPTPHNYRRIPVVTRGPYAFHRIDDLYGHDLTGDGLPGDGGGAPVPELAAPQKASSGEA